VVSRLTAWLLGQGSYLRMESEYHLNLPEYAIKHNGQALYEIMGF
jgi:hypothetical protein